MQAAGMIASCVRNGPASEMVTRPIAAGHNMLGLSMAPATGKLIAEILNNQTPHIDPAPYSIKRFM